MDAIGTKMADECIAREIPFRRLKVVPRGTLRIHTVDECDVTTMLATDNKSEQEIANDQRQQR